MEDNYKIVDFENYCKTCKHKDLKERLDPCNECLDYGVNENSEKPIRYEENGKSVPKIMYTPKVYAKINDYSKFYTVDNGKEIKVMLKEDK